MRFATIFLFGLLLLAACTKTEPAINPDPNHTHADFVLWIEGKKLDFSASQFMSGSSTDEEDGDPTHKHLHEYLHLHDANGHIIHRHKPGLTLNDFFTSMPGMRYQGNEFKFMDCITCQHSAGTYQVRLFVNGVEERQGSSYVFSDDDKLLITDTTDPVKLRKEIRMVTDEACLYSHTCPERGKPPAENCIADPEVPCVGQ